MKKALLLAMLAGILFNGCRRSETWEEINHPTGWINYPIETNVTITYWLPMSEKVTPNFINYSFTPMGKELTEQTGININWIHPPATATAANEQFNLMVAADDLPDVFVRDLHRLYPGGPQKAIEDKVILQLNDIFNSYAPNLLAFLNANPDIDKMIKTDTGAYYCFPFIRYEPELRIFLGPLIRQDWLDELGLDMPQTIDDWYSVLTAFKNRKGSPAPFTFEYTNLTYYETLPFALAFDAPSRFFIGEDGVVRFGPIEDGRRDFLRTFARWYREGLIDPDLVTLRNQQVGSKMVSGTSGASFGALGSRMGAWITAALPTNPTYNLVAAPYPVLRRGDSPKMTATEIAFTGVGSASISAKCRYPQIAARLLDWAYSEEGHMFNNFGIEGESYIMVDGYPVFTDFIFSNPNGWTVDQSIAAFARAASDGPLIQDIRYQEQMFTYQVQRDAVKLWSIEGAENFVLPPITPTPRESQDLARIMNEIRTYRDEMEVRFILGMEQLTDAAWENYINTIRRMGIDQALEIQNAALARYNAR
ncbi:MAG: extracellular solute-binding protein [Treponema sp.]|jgi:putative aldouronate transport system substrate-binding protein|nr:extracellular solute-binding protein [Treponema sp.]